MLVLSRKKNEGITIGGEIRIVCVEIRGDKVRLGVEAPKDLSVHRDEVQQAIDREFEGRPSSFQRILSELEKLKKENAELRLKLAV